MMAATSESERENLLDEPTARDVLAEMVKGHAEPMLRGPAAQWALAEIDRLRIEANEAATAYDDLKLAYEREASLADQRAAEVEQAERRGRRSGYEDGFNEGQRGD